MMPLSAVDEKSQGRKQAHLSSLRISFVAVPFHPKFLHSFLVVNASRRVMEIEAEHIKLMKQDLT